MNRACVDVSRGSWGNCTEVGVGVFVPHTAAQVSWYGKVGPECGPPAVKEQGQGQPRRAEPVQCQSSCAPTQLLPFPFSSQYPQLPPPPPRCPSTKDEWRVGMGLGPSPPSGAACLCQDVTLHIVMKGAIKVTAGWNGACCPPLSSSPTLSLSLVSRSTYCLVCAGSQLLVIRAFSYSRCEAQ